MSSAREFVDWFASTLSPEAGSRFGEFERWGLRKSMETCRMEELPAVRGNPDGVRCSGAMPCGVCGKRYDRHPMDWRYLSYDSRPFLNVICDGRRVKL